MSTQIEPTTGGKMQIKDAGELADYYGIPKTLANRYFMELGGSTYLKVPMLIRLAAKKGYQRIEVTKPEVDEKGVWRCEARIYPALGTAKLSEINRLPNELRAKALDYLTAPTVEWGQASKETVRMSTMQPYLAEMAIKRAVARACRLYSGDGGTSYEELPDAELSQDELKEKAAGAEQVQAKIV